MGTAVSDSAVHGIGPGTASSPMLPPDDEARSKMTPAAVVERLDQHIIGQVRKETIGHSLILIRVNLMSITQSWTWI